MNSTAVDELNRILAIPELHLLTPEDIAFLKARRSYLNPSQRLGYKELNLFGDDKKSQSIDKNLPNANDLSEEELANLENDVPVDNSQKANFAKKK